WRKRAPKVFRGLRLALLCLMPVVWIFPFREFWHPGIGCFLWIAAMIVALFSHSLSSGYHLWSAKGQARSALFT
ncbi:MAG TPA: hypothetical protein VFT65_09020, partial [Candidatus Angelobacter sp.]|nr:hypothetical protein [Candidatus Angelobacter sp.]